MTPQAFTAFAEEYESADLPDDMLAAKWQMSAATFDEVVRVGYGSVVQPMPLRKKNPERRGVRHVATVSKLAKEGELMPDDLALSPLEATEMLSPSQRMAGYALTEQELNFANLVLKGFNTTAACCAAFEVFDEHEARRKAAVMLKSPRIQTYIEELKGQRLYAPVRGKAYLEAVLWQVIDRSLELEQAFDEAGKRITGRCAYNPKALLGASVALMKLRGWDKEGDDKGTGTLSHVERLRMINMNKKG